MANGAIAPGPGPPAEVHIFVLPPVAGGKHSLLCYPRRSGDTAIFYTSQGNNPTAGRSREVMWIPHGLGAGQMLTIREKATSPGRGHFAGVAPIHNPTPFQLSGPPARGPAPARQVCWAYDVILSDATGVLATCDPEVIIVEDP